MSKIEVNTVEPQCGTTLTLGASGDTVTLGAGVTNDLGGGVQWETTPKTANFNASAGEGYFVDTSSNTVTVTLPAGVAGESVTILDYVSNANTNAIIFAPQSGEKIEGGTAGQGVTANRQATTLTYSGATQGWLVSSAGDSGPIAPATITYNTAAGSLGTLEDNERSNPNGNLSPITATSSFGNLTYSIQSGSLPAGLTINSTTGAFVGTATQVGSDTTSNFTVRATVTETGTTSDRSFSITVNTLVLFVTASGGTETTSGNFKIHTFTGPGTFTVSCAGNPGGSTTVDYLVVAGGGAGGSGSTGGGGGAGGYRESSGAASGCYSRSPLGSGVSALPVSAQGYPITVGSGGSKGSPGPEDNNTTGGTSGSNSVFSTITSAGGGRGASSGSPSNNPAENGGSGGGGNGSYTNGNGNTPPVSPAQGVNGRAATTSPTGIGGGGSSINGTPTIRATGGGGGKNSGTGVPADSGPRGGGKGGSNNISGNSGATGPSDGGDAGANTGSGGGGGGRQNSVASRSGGAGGSGIVIIRYKYQ
jgi:hypothetical protein